MEVKKQARIGIIGTGFIGHGLKIVIEQLPDMVVSSILTQRNLSDFPGEAVYTNSIQELIDKSDIVVECNGEPIYATEVISNVLDAGIPVATMDAELQITSGTYLMRKGFITEAEGDQPGMLAVLHRELVNVGFKPLVYGNLKGYLNHHPKLEDMQYWAKIQGISIEQVTEFTDGTKLQIEQALVANGLGAVIAKRGMHGFESDNIKRDSEKLAEIAKEIGSPISDYLLRSPNANHYFPPGTFITAEYDPRLAGALKYLKLGDGPYYTLIKNYHLCQLEIPNTLRQVLRGEGPLLTNSINPTASVCGIAKSVLEPGTRISQEDRGFFIRGEAIGIKEMPTHVPIGLLGHIVLKRRVEPDQIIEFDDVELEESLAYDAWHDTLDRILSSKTDQ